VQEPSASAEVLDAVDYREYGLPEPLPQLR
jgi:hypothetical protein